MSKNVDYKSYFAVVADEIRKLAEQSSASTSDIDKIVKELQNNSKNAVSTMERVTDINQEQSNRVSSTRDKYMMTSETIEESIEAIR